MTGGTAETDDPTAPATTSADGTRFTLAVHGGAFSQPHRLDEQMTFLQRILSAGRVMLADGSSAADVAVEMVSCMEDSALFVAGKGSGPNDRGVVECDAAIMSGDGRRAGAVAGLRRTRNPIQAARFVMERRAEVMLVGEGAEEQLQAEGIAAIDDPAAYFQPFETAKHDSSNNARANAARQHGTVGAAALDTQGRLCAATSTGGLEGKSAGRVGDSPIIGAGTYADDRVAVSCTGHGEFFMRSVAAYDVAAAMRYGNDDLYRASSRVIYESVGNLGGRGGLVAVDRAGKFCRKYNSAGMVHGFVTHDRAPAIGC